MTRVLYISYTGVLDPLGESQVLQYVLGLAKTHDMSLLSFERAEAIANTEHLERVEAKCREAGIRWTRMTYHRKPPLAATLYDIVTGSRKATQLVRDDDIQLVHCRSYVAGLMGLNVKKKTGAKFIFDMRGFWADERAESGIWSQKSNVYKIVKRVERQLFQNADHVISLTKSGAVEFQKFDYLQASPPPFTVIPTCTNLDLFAPHEKTNAPFTIGYVGSVGSWYMFDKVAQAVKMIFEKRPDARFLVINKGGHDVIRNDLISAGVDLDRVEVREVPYTDVGKQIGRMDAGIFFITPLWSKRASCPTRMGEFLACGKPCLANADVGDVETDLNETGTGVVVREFDDATISAAIDQLFELIEDPDMARRCRETAEARFSLPGGIESYSKVYDVLGA